jgi:hypothetical protein
MEQIICSMVTQDGVCMDGPGEDGRYWMCFHGVPKVVDGVVVIFADPPDESLVNREATHPFLQDCHTFNFAL